MKAFKKKWVFGLKTEKKNLQPRYKAQLVVKEFDQKNSINFEKFSSHVVKIFSNRVIIGLAISMNLKIKQLEVKIAFFHSDLEKNICKVAEEIHS